jgi:DNA-binding LacI/PurR family transcriptional regulator
VTGVILTACPCLDIRGDINPAIPHVWIDCNDSPADTPDICQIQSDQYYSGLIAARELWKRGCTKPLILTGATPSHRTLEREKGFWEEFASHGISLEKDRILRLSAGVRDALVDTRQAILYKAYQKVPFDSIFAISDWRALGAYLAINELGLRIPEDVKLIGYDGVSAVSRSALHITSVQQDIERIAQGANDLLLHMIRQEEIPQKHIIIPTDILPGQTV